jgi:uncharacterized pyridoxal phosphate-containing UPF0001 family protein
VVFVNLEGVAAQDQVSGAHVTDDVARLHSVRSRVRQAEMEAGRTPGGVALLLATKTIEPARILEVIAAGQLLIGENRVQEVLAKARALSGSGHECHLIGHLQGNKVNQVLPHVTCVQTVDSVELGSRLNRRISSLDRTLHV